MRAYRQTAHPNARTDGIETDSTKPNPALSALTPAQTGLKRQAASPPTPNRPNARTDGIETGEIIFICVWDT